ncbi:protein kinase [Lysinibacillus telephonicus]|uniref:non-specific serine/threonine protein kinase n=1 Tax=Lysinibacillus telephonicus TaxID=1714840 RepID=A0A3S0QY71_9BACI|nr:protein kinase [Lysinibacillus telephonicus]RTQ96279.1 serine/threonine protein kinase [Lysinibacillus telephonicus]
MIHNFFEFKYHKIVKSYIENETDYHFIEQLGVGSYGIAYLIEESKSQKKYVLKRMKLKHRNNKKLRHKFQQEITMLKEMGLPRVPSVISHGELYDTPFYIMDYIDGQTFEQAIFRTGKSFSVEQSLNITKELLEIVVDFHKKGIVHRDLRIPNILLKEDALHIIDFGLAAYIKENVDLEKIDNPKKLENHISDLYFIGHFLLFLLYSNFTPSERKERSWQEELQLPPEVENYIERLLLIRPAFSSAEEALAALSVESAEKGPCQNNIW